MPNSPLVKTPEQLQADMLRTYRSSMIINGHSGNPNVNPGSDIFNTTLALSNELGVALANVINAGNNLMPDTATGLDLERVMAIYGLSRRAASPAYGFVTLSMLPNISVLVPTDSKLSDANGVVYFVVNGGNYSDGYNIPVQSQDAGLVGNPGLFLTWIDTPPYASSQANLVLADYVPGTDIESDANARQRLLNILQNPPQFGNWSDISNLVDAFLPSVIEKSFIYSCADGPATQHIAVVSPPDIKTGAAFSREVSDIYVDQTYSYTVGSLPDSTNTVLTTVSDTYFDVVIGLNIPYPVGGSNNGIGGGWLNFSPWPTAMAVADTITGPKTLRVTVQSGSTLPQRGISKINIIYRTLTSTNLDGQSNFTSQTLTITDYTVLSPTSIEITVDLDFSYIENAMTEAYVCPACVNFQSYLDNVITYFSSMGPGEKTDIPGLLPRALRQPPVASTFPSSVDGRLLKSLNNNFNEIIDNSFLYRTSAVGPSIPTAITDPPKIYVPRNIGFYPII